MMEVTVTPAQPSNFTFYLRILGGRIARQVAVNGKGMTGAKPGE